MVKRVILALIILCSLSLYEFKFLGSISKIIEIAGIGLMFATSISLAIYDDSFRFKQNFTPFILIILFSLPFSMYIADRFHGQTLGISLMAQRSIYLYFLYFTLHQIKIKPEDIEKLFVTFGMVYIALYMVQFVLYPIEIFNVTMGEARGTVRIFLGGTSYLIIMYFYSLQKFLEKQNYKYGILMLAALIIVILLGSRYLLSIVGAVTILNIILSKRVKSKLTIYALSISGILLIYFAFQNILQEIIDTALHQDPINAENIRYRAIAFFLTSYFPNAASYIFGNGAYEMSSELSRSLEMISEKHGYYLADIGIFGEYVNYGAIFLVGALFIVFKSLLTKIQPKYYYLKYYIFYVAVGMVLGGGFANSGSIVSICITIYLIDISKFQLANPDTGLS